ncbi:hypothetical protein IW261DRAFT_1557798 [Armillaria novae-zelandiae]|uniref:Protein kinase domain-containing protein n=1 Tax=Armillaria novae-zelandiae TaxID=153914 RepID=A0AA39UR71_9AGAR|nr:hypothetical protein IW261DRAFT_1557798 [Armillaria novae-zelandiae]
MDSLSAVNRTSKLIGDIRTKCSNHRAASETIQLTEGCLQCVQSRLDIFRQYLKKAEPTLSSRAQNAFFQSLRRVEDLSFELEVQLLPNIVKGKLKWIEPRKRRIEELVFEIKASQAIDVLYKQLLRTYSHSLAMYGNSSKMYDDSLTSALALARRVHNRGEQIQPPLIPNRAVKGVGPVIHDRAFATLNDTDVVYVEAHRYAESRSEIEKIAAIFYAPDFPFHTRTPPPLPLMMMSKLNMRVPVPTLGNALNNGIRIALEDRFRIAAEVTMAVLELHAVGWVHQAICSDNVLLSTKGGEKGANADAQVSSAYLIGLKPVRLQGWGLKRLPAPNDFVEQGDSLQAILWKARAVLGEPKRGETEYERLRECARRLGNNMGSKYAKAAIACLVLSGQPKDTRKLREKLYEDVLCPLRQIMDGFKDRKGVQTIKT